VAVLLSSIATSVAQSLAALLGYLVAGVPHPVFFGFVTFLVALVPVLGATPMVVAIAVLQLATGRTLPGFFLLAWAVPVSLIDNFVKPALLRRGLAVHPVVIFFTLIGGIAAFGALGILLGPLALAFLLAAIRMIRRDQGS
jgi:predicted PurR-regulated permease PerM